MDRAAIAPEEKREDAAATIAVALIYLQREAVATGLAHLAGLIDEAAQEAHDCAITHDA